MPALISRSQFLCGDFSGESTPIRPPWALKERLFIDRCDSCGDCVTACEAGLIKSGRGRFPEIDFSSGGCDFCAKCVAACKTGALQQHQSQSPWSIHAHILDACLLQRGVVCRICGEACCENAIRFQMVVGGHLTIELNSERCSGCGACIAICPEQAVRMIHQDAEKTFNSKKQAVQT